MASESDFNAAVSASRASDLVAKKWPDAACGAYGGYPAGPTESYGGTGIAEVAITHPRMYDPVVTPAPAGPDGMLGTGVDSQRSVHAHFGQHSPSNFDAGASNTCSGDAQIAKAWPDAQGGALGSVSDGMKD